MVFRQTSPAYLPIQSGGVPEMALVVLMLCLFVFGLLPFIFSFRLIVIFSVVDFAPISHASEDGSSVGVVSKGCRVACRWVV
jgi:hypothetical protein